MVGDVRRGGPFGKIGGWRGEPRLVLYGKLSAGLGPVEDVAQADVASDLEGSPYGVVRSGQHRLTLQGEEGGNVGGRKEPAGVPEPHVVGHEDEEGAGHRPLAQPPEPLGEARPVGGEPLPDDAQGPPVGEGHGGVQRQGAVPAEPDGEGDAGEEAGHAVDGGQCVEALHQAAPPLGGERAVPQQRLEGPVLVVREPSQPGGGEVKPPRRGERVGGVEHGGAEPAGLQPLDGLVDRGLRPARHGDHLLAVEEGHRGEGAEEVRFTSFGSHSPASSSVSFPTASPVSSSPASAGAVLGFPVCFPPSGPCFASSSCAAFSMSSTPLR